MRDLSLHLMDIVQNSIVAGATTVDIKYSYDKDILAITIVDNGSGMTEEVLKAAVDPFYTTRTTRDVGLGLPLFKMSAQTTGGEFSIKSAIGKGTSITASYNTAHIDMLPLGDTASTVSLLMAGNPDINFTFGFTKNGVDFRVSTKEIKEILEDVPITSPTVASWLKEYIEGNIS